MYQHVAEAVRNESFLPCPMHRAMSCLFHRLDSYAYSVHPFPLVHENRRGSGELPFWPRAGSSVGILSNWSTMKIKVIQKLSYRLADKWHTHKSLHPHANTYTERQTHQQLCQVIWKSAFLGKRQWLSFHKKDAFDTYRSIFLPLVNTLRSWPLLRSCPSISIYFALSDGFEILVNALIPIASLTDWIPSIISRPQIMAFQGQQSIKGWSVEAPFLSRHARKKPLILQRKEGLNPLYMCKIFQLQRKLRDIIPLLLLPRKGLEGSLSEFKCQV